MNIFNLSNPKKYPKCPFCNDTLVMCPSPFGKFQHSNMNGIRLLCKSNACDHIPSFNFIESSKSGYTLMGFSFDLFSDVGDLFIIQKFNENKINISKVEPDFEGSYDNPDINANLIELDCDLDVFNQEDLQKIKSVVNKISNNVVLI